MVRDPLSLRPEAPQPLYQQVKQFVIDGIRAGEWGDAKRLPSENFLVEQLNVSRMTVHRALRELKSEGVIIRVPGRGTFVSAEKPRSTLLETQDIAAEITSRGATYRCRVMAQDQVRADKDLAAALGVRTGDAVFHSAIVHEENGVAVQFEERWINPAVAPGYLEQDFTVRTPHRYLIMCAPITEVEHVLHAIRPDRRVREFLRLTADEPCLLLARRTWAGIGRGDAQHVHLSRRALQPRRALQGDGRSGTPGPGLDAVGGDVPPECSDARRRIATPTERREAIAASSPVMTGGVIASCRTT